MNPLASKVQVYCEVNNCKGKVSPVIKLNKIIIFHELKKIRRATSKVPVPCMWPAGHRLPASDLWCCYRMEAIAYMLMELSVDAADEDECISRRHDCPAESTCQNDVGSYSCQCGAGFFGNDKFCQGL